MFHVSFTVSAGLFRVRLVRDSAAGAGSNAPYFVWYEVVPSRVITRVYTTSTSLWLRQQNGIVCVWTIYINEETIYGLVAMIAIYAS